jgi:hypothetical protein
LHWIGNGRHENNEYSLVLQDEGATLFHHRQQNMFGFMFD